MANFEESIVNQRFRLVYKELEKTGKIRNKSDLAEKLGTYNHIVHNILQGKRNLTVEQIHVLCDMYDINTNFLFGSSNKMLSGEQTSDIPHLSSHEIYQSGRNNIVLVSQKALAGYALRPDDIDYLKDMKRFSIPNVEGNLIAFEISGDSMLPNIANGDILICEELERGEPIRDNAMYVVVTDVVVAKRVQQIKKNNELSSLLLISDNSAIYRPYEIEVEEVKQLLKVKMRLSTHGIS